MHDLFLKLPIGEKISFGFGLVGMLFLGVIWQYHSTLVRSLDDYQQLQDTQATKKNQVLAIENNLLFARQVETEFLLKRESGQAQAVMDYLGAANQESDLLSGIDSESAELANRFQLLLNTYLTYFQAVETAWKLKGLDENSGLQGSFRNAVHDLEAMAGNLKTDRLYLNLLHIRRAEKDLGLRREVTYQERVSELMERFRKDIRHSELSAELQSELLEEITVYSEAFDNYAAAVLGNQDAQGGTGPFRDSAHRLEDLINRHYVPDLEQNILQLRRREKDYLLRGDPAYVDMALREIQIIRQQLERSQVSLENRTRFLSLLARYQDDFLALVQQNNKISILTTQMEQVAANVADLVRENVRAVNQTMLEMTYSINATSQERTRWMNWVVLLATLLGIYFAVKITRHIVHPVKKMAVLLEELTYSEQVEHMPFVEAGRDEINAMAGSLNTLAENRNRFISWWKNSMDEAEACRQLQSIVDNAARNDSDVAIEVHKVREELLEALAVKKTLLSKEFNEIRKNNDEVLKHASALEHPGVNRGELDKHAKAMRYKAEMIRKALDMLSYKT